MSDIEHRYPGQLQVWRASAHRFVLPGGEGVPDVQRRIMSFYSEAVCRHRGETIILVGHGVALAALLVSLQQQDLCEAWHEGRGRMSNAGVTIVRGDHDASAWSIPLFDGVAHLDGVPT